jgi:hypothetical protein
MSTAPISAAKSVGRVVYGSVCFLMESEDTRSLLQAIHDLRFSREAPRSVRTCPGPLRSICGRIELQQAA